MTIIVLQSFPFILNRLEQKLGSRAEGIHFTSNHKEMLDRVLAAKDAPGRTVVLSSWHFYGEYVNGEMLACGVKGINPSAWFFVWSTQALMSTASIDGVIIKDDAMFEKAIEFLSAVRNVNNLEELRQCLPWLTT